MAKSLTGIRGNGAYAFMILIGWSGLMLVAANAPGGEALGYALIDGQLYFAGWPELTAALMLVLAAAIALPRLMPRLLHARFFPQHEGANRLPAWRWHVGFDLLVAVGLAVATATLGVMGAFVLILLPAWAAFKVAPSWGWTLGISALLGITAYGGAFVLALGLDQPFGPILVVVCLGLGGLVGRSP